MKVKAIFYIIAMFVVSLLFVGCPQPPPPPPEPPIEVADSLKTGLPVIFIYTEDGQPIVSKDYYLKANVFIADLEHPENNLVATSGVKGRGNYTWTLPKKPYRLKFDEKQSLFGLPEAKNWVLLANYLDYTLIFTSVAFELGRQFELPWTHHTFAVEVVVNDQYMGSYVLTENKEVGKGRVDIGGKDGAWFVEADGYYDEDPKFMSDVLQLPFMIAYPEDLSEPEYDFVKNDLNQFEAKLFEEDYPNNDFMDLMNVNSFIDYIMVYEIVQNFEISAPRSMYWYKAGADEKISLGPLWDFDNSFGFQPSTFNFFHGYDGELFADKPEAVEPGDKLFSKLFESPELRAVFKERWNNRYRTILEMTEYIDSYAKEVEKSQKLNAEIWGWTGNDPDYMTEIARMKQWWIDRVTYINSRVHSF